MTRVCTDKGTFNGCADAFKKKFQQVWNRAFSSVTEVNDQTPSSDGSLTLTGSQVFTAGTNLSWSGNTLNAETGISSYTDLTDKPQINDITLTGNKSSSDLGLASSSDLNSYYTKTQADALLALKQAVLTAGVGVEITNNVISADTAFHAQIYASLPTASESYKNTVALIADGSAYKQYMCVYFSDTQIWTWVQTGSTQIDLSAYKTWALTKTYIDDADALKSSAHIKVESI